MMGLNQHQLHLKTVRASLSALISPTQYIIDWPANMLRWAGESMQNQQTLLAENANLSVQVLLLKAQLQKLILLEQENTQLRELLHSSPRASERVLVGELMSVDPDPFAQQVIINKGEKQKLFLGQPVLDANGVFGQVIQIGAYTSRIMLITDTRSAVPVQDNRSGTRGIVVGNGDSAELGLVDMPATADIKVGDKLVTSGLGGVFPVGYPIGVITEIRQSPGNEFSNVDVLPAAHLNEGHLVLLLWPAAEKILHAEQKATALLEKKKQQAIAIKQKVSKHVH